VSSLAFVTLRPNESQDSILKRFRKKVVKSGVLSTIRRKRWFVSKSELRRVEKKKAARRVKRRQVTHEEFFFRVKWFVLSYGGDDGERRR
jgi:small subunit ribosomal protein S21